MHDLPAGRRRLPILIGIGLALVFAAQAAGTAPAAQESPAPGRKGLRVSLALPRRTAKLGDRLAVTAVVTNDTGRPASGSTVLLNLIDMTPGQPTPLGPGSWTGDPSSVSLPVLPPGGSASATWHLVLIHPGPLGIYASVLNGAAGAVESSPVHIMGIKDRQVLNPEYVLPVAMGEPALLLAFFAFLRLTSPPRTG